MKAKLFDIQGNAKKEIEIPKFFSEKIREDLVAKVLEVKKNKQPYAPSLVAGKQHAAKGKLRRRRHVWRSGYGRGSSRVPRKIFSQKGSSFNWEVAEVPQARGGMRAHPPKVIAMLQKLKINKKEMGLALKSALSATANKKIIGKKYKTISERDIKDVPFVVDGKIVEMKTKELNESLKKILGKKMFDVSEKRKTIRSGKGKMRGRKYKSNAGLLIVTGKGEKVKTRIFDVSNAKNLGVVDLAKGGLGRITIYTENAINELNERLEK